MAAQCWFYDQNLWTWQSSSPCSLFLDFFFILHTSVLYTRNSRLYWKCVFFLTSCYDATDVQRWLVAPFSKLPEKQKPGDISWLCRSRTHRRWANSCFSPAKCSKVSGKPRRKKLECKQETAGVWEYLGLTGKSCVSSANWRKIWTMTASWFHQPSHAEVCWWVCTMCTPKLLLTTSTVGTCHGYFVPTRQQIWTCSVMLLFLPECCKWAIS